MIRLSGYSEPLPPHLWYKPKRKQYSKNYCIFLIRKPELFIHHKLKRLRQMLSYSIHLAKVKTTWNFPDICGKSFPNINSPKYVKLRNGPWQVDTLKERGSLDGVEKKRKNSHYYERLKYRNSIYTLYVNVSLFNWTQIGVTNRVINDFSAFKSLVLFFQRTDPPNNSYLTSPNADIRC